jgi:hypothetical protein
MSFNKGDIVSLDFEMPDTGIYIKHSVVIISCDEVYNHDKCYICAMMTSNGIIDPFSFKIDNSMLDKPGNKSNSQVRCHLITYVLERHIIPSQPYNKLKPQAIERLLAYISAIRFEI